MSADEQRLAVDRARQAVIALGALVVCAAAVAAIVDLAGGPNVLGDAGTIVGALAMAFFGVVTMRESDDARLRHLGLITVVAAAVLVVLTVVELLA